MDGMRWRGSPVVEDGVVERRFDVARDGGVVPGVLWLPEQGDRAAPLVLMGHGGSGHKRTDRQVRMARWFARTAGIAAAAIDGPYHGDRMAEPLESRDYQQRMAASGVDVITDGMVSDWCATVDALSQLDAVDANRVAYLGFSMGTRFGLPYVAAAGPGLRCAVLGKYGMRQPSAMPKGIDMAARFKLDAPGITVPTLFHVQWDDELFDRDGQFELFDLLGSSNKQLIAFPGPHHTTTPAAITAWSSFIVHHLTDG